MIRLYEILLLLYPPSHRLAFGAEMSAVFAQSLEDRRKQGWISRFRFLIAEFFCLLRDATAVRLTGAEAIDLTRMRPPDLSRESYTSALDEVLHARRSVDFNLRRMQDAIAIHAFREARFYSDQDRMAREHLRLVREKYRIPE
jgi:hypothetical protein